MQFFWKGLEKLLQYHNKFTCDKPKEATVKFFSDQDVQTTEIGSSNTSQAASMIVEVDNETVEDD